MFVFEIVQSLFVSVILAYLSFTGSIAHSIESYLRERNVDHNIPGENVDVTASEELTLLSRLYASGEGVSKVLFENEAFKKAAETIPQSSAVAVSSLSREELDIAIRESLVNILCEYKTDTYTRTTTGTGFFVDEAGVILTNAHVAQFLLLESASMDSAETECVIRTGNPALPRYKAELLFISPTWMFTNANLITAESPRGTGEYDYALLYVSESTDASVPLPETFTALPLHTNLLAKAVIGETVVTAGYPAERLAREGARAELESKIARTTIDELYTFGSNYADIFSITESPVGEQGASGGPVVSESHGGAIGLIVTKGDILTEGEHSLRALTLSYIDRTIQEETGLTLKENTGGDLPYRGTIFKQVLAPFLTRLLTQELKEE